MNNISDFICNNIIIPTTNMISYKKVKESTNDNDKYISSHSTSSNSTNSDNNTVEDSYDYNHEITRGKFKRVNRHLTIKIPNTRNSIRQNHLDENFDYEIDGESYFKHLNFAGQTYLQHFRAAMGYSWRSFKASFFFFTHALWPDIFQQTGSREIINLGDELIQKYRNRINYLTEHYRNN